MSLPASAAVVGAVLGIGAGFAIGRLTAPHSTATGLGTPEKQDTQPTRAYGGPSNTQLSATSSQAAKPLTFAELQGLLTEMDGPGFRGMSNFHKLADLQDRLKASDLASLAATLCASPLDPTRLPGFFLVMSTFAETDPEGAWKLALSTKGAARQNSLSAVVSALAAQDPSRALAMAAQANDPQLKRQLRSNAIMGIAQKDPQRALDLVLEGGGGAEDAYPVSVIFSAWARRDIEGAKAAAGHLSGQMAEQARQALFTALAQQDPKSAWSYALTMPIATEAYRDPRVQVVQKWAQTDPQAAIDAALSIPESRLRGQAMGAAIAAWAGTDFSGALAYTVSVEDSTLRADLLQNLTSNSQGKCGDLLAAVLGHMPPGDNFRNAVASIFSRWAQENPSEAAAALPQIPQGSIYSSAASNIASQWVHAASRKQDVFDWAQTLPEGDARDGSLFTVFNEWASSSPQEALKALNSLPLTEQRNSARALASGWSRNSPDAALAWASALPDPDTRNAALQAAVSQWASSSPETAARYVEKLPDSQRLGPMQSVVTNWASKDTAAAAAWLDRQPSGPAKDAALVPLARRVAQEDPEAALTWIAGMSDDRQRLSQTEHVLRDWLRQNPADARQWLSSSSIPPDFRAKLLK